MKYYIGLTQWHHPDWYASGTNNKHALATYSQHFSSVEGNSTFYGLPKAHTIESWNNATPENFRFCFKFPKSISHQACLQHCTATTTEFLDLLTPLEGKLGIIWLQLHQKFSPEQLYILEDFLNALPDTFNYGVEVRHLDFFAKGDAEKRFNQLLIQQHINRVIFDTRSLFAHPTNDESTQEGLRKKPRVPLHVLATADTPLVRFISPMDTKLAETELEQWADKFIQWMSEGKTPYLFIHTPDNAKAPQLAQHFSKKIAARNPEISAVTLWEGPTEQTSLF